MKQSLRLLAACLLPLYGGYAQASEMLAIPNEYGLAATWGSDGGQDLYAHADLNLGGPRLTLGYGESYSERYAETEKSKEFLASISTQPLRLLSLALDYENWQQRDVGEIDTFRLNTFLNTTSWSYSVAPHVRTISINTRFIFRPVIDFESEGVDLGVGYYHDKWSAKLSYSRYDYSRNVSLLAIDRRVDFIFSPSTLNYAFSLEADQKGLTFDYRLTQFTALRVTHISSSSAVDKSELRTTAVRLLYQLTSHWSLKILTGISSETAESNDASFIAFGIEFSL